MLTLALVGLLLIPPPGTTSRERDFCSAWLGLSLPQRYAQLQANEVRDVGGDPEASSCQATRRPRVLSALDSECRNWRLLMDFEVRAIVDREGRRCPEPSG